MTLKNSKGFTLVEMLVVIAIISVLAAALFPAISNALGTASATALKQKGRGIWVAITSSNMEREPLNLGAVWPKDIGPAPDGDGTVSADSVAYFNYLLSDGTDTSKPTKEADLRVVADLTPDALCANNVPAGTTDKALDAKNIAWCVVAVGDSTPGEIPFLISKNCQTPPTLQQQATAQNSPRIELDPNVDPFKGARAVWVSRGGGTFDARAKYFTIAQLMGLGESTTTYDYWLTASGKQ